MPALFVVYLLVASLPSECFAEASSRPVLHFKMHTHQANPPKPSTPLYVRLRLPPLSSSLSLYLSLQHVHTYLHPCLELANTEPLGGEVWLAKELLVESFLLFLPFLARSLEPYLPDALLAAERETKTLPLALSPSTRNSLCPHLVFVCRGAPRKFLHVLPSTSFTLRDSSMYRSISLPRSSYLSTSPCLSPYPALGLHLPFSFAIWMAVSEASVKGRETFVSLVFFVSSSSCH